jgi:hypothetical protein
MELNTDYPNRSPDDRPDAIDLMSHPFVAEKFANTNDGSSDSEEEVEKSSNNRRSGGYPEPSVNSTSLIQRKSG